MTSGTNQRRLVFFGNERLVSGLSHSDAPVLRSLIVAGYDVAAVVINNADTKSRTKKTLEVARLADQHAIPLFSPVNPTDLIDELRKLNADAGILAAYGRIVPQSLIDLFPFGIINIHPSLLPKYRGPSPIESAIANGDASTGVSIMALSSKMDAGPVYHQVTINLPAYETAPHLSQKLASLAASELLATLPKIFNGSLKAEAQNEASAVYCQLIQKSDARLNPYTMTAVQAERLVRAYKAYPKARLRIGEHDLIIAKAHVSGSGTTPLDMEFTEGFLSIDELVAPSGKTMSADAFIRGYLTK